MDRSLIERNDRYIIWLFTYNSDFLRSTINNLFLMYVTTNKGYKAWIESTFDQSTDPNIKYMKLRQSIKQQRIVCTYCTNAKYIQSSTNAKYIPSSTSVKYMFPSNKKKQLSLQNKVKSAYVIPYVKNLCVHQLFFVKLYFVYEKSNI